MQSHIERKSKNRLWAKQENIEQKHVVVQKQIIDRARKRLNKGEQ